MKLLTFIMAFNVASPEEYNIFSWQIFPRVLAGRP